MALWWIGNTILILVIFVVVILLQRLESSAAIVGKRADTVDDQAGGIAVAVDDVKQLIPVRDAVKRTAAALSRYATALARTL